MNNQSTIDPTKTPKASAKWSNPQEAVGEVSEKVIGAARGVAEDVRERATSYFEDFNASPTAFIRNNPVPAAIGGVFVGFLLGAAVFRRALK